MRGCKRQAQLIKKGRSFSTVNYNGGSRWRGKSEFFRKVCRNAETNTKAVAPEKAMATTSLTKAPKSANEG
jgi:hypothetical protein